EAGERLGDGVHDAALHLAVGGDRVGADARHAVGAALVGDGDDLAVAVEADDQLADVGVAAAAGDDRDGVPVDAVGQQRVGPVAATGDHDVDVVEQAGQLDVLLDALQVAGDDDLVDALGGERVDLRLDGVGHVRVHDHVARAGDGPQRRGGGADDADLLAPLA